jgi:site-specific DNA recombinase
MSRFHLDPCLTPRNGRILRAVGITRISTLNQDVKSLADQQALLRKWVADRYDGPVEWTFIEGQGSGECVDRKQVAEADDLVASGQFDLVIMEDPSRHMRRVHAVLFCEACEDVDTRLIAINDGIDTFKEWRLQAFFAAMKHEQTNKDTSLRIKRTLRNRFSEGGVVQFTVFGLPQARGCQERRRPAEGSGRSVDLPRMVPATQRRSQRAVHARLTLLAVRLRLHPPVRNDPHVAHVSRH